MPKSLPTSILVSAKIRVAAMEGVPITIIQKGDDHSGALLIKINRLDGYAEVLSQVHHEGEMAWIPASTELMSEKEADSYMMDQVRFDPDLWAVEIEDKKGRHWFDGPILDL